MTRRRALLARVESGGRLPSAYQEVEYLESDSNQRIVLNVLPSATDVITVKCKLTSIAAHTGIFGAAVGNYNGIGTNTNFANFYAQIGGGNAYRQSSTPKDTNTHTHVLDYARLVYSIDGVETSLAGITLALAANNYGLWFHNGGGAYVRYTAGRIYSFSIPNRINLVPCYRKDDSKPGMYDLVSNTFYTNDGTGEFTVGADIN